MLPSASSARSTDPQAADPAPQAWAREIRDFLLGRLGRSLSTDELGEAHRTALTAPPIRRWWLFEGKRYAGIEGRLADAAAVLTHKARQLLSTFNPRVRLSTRPEGHVDWGRTLSLGPRWPIAEYALHSSAIGIDEPEREALAGWMGWLAAEWHGYTQQVTCPARDGWDELQAHALAVAVGDTAPAAPSGESLRRWAHLTRRSRWPFLRQVVAETLRAYLEPQDLDALPLPTDRAALFELFCIMRVVRALTGVPTAIRWFATDYDNEATFDDVQVKYQRSFTLEEVLDSEEYRGPLARAIRLFGVQVHRRADGWIYLDPPRAGFSEIIVEAKSGGQTFRDALLQMKTYRAAAEPGKRRVVWGMIEVAGEMPDPVLDDVEASAAGPGDLWVFSGTKDVGRVVRRVFGPLQRP